MGIKFVVGTANWIARKRAELADQPHAAQAPSTCRSERGERVPHTPLPKRVRSSANGQNIGGNGEDQPIRRHRPGSALAFAGQVPELLLELLGAQPLLVMAGEDRLDGSVLVNLADDDYPRALHLGLAESVHPAMQLFARRQ